MTYPDAVAAIAALEPRGWRLGLDRMQEFCDRAGLDDALGAPGGPQFIHVAGTNGKGTTTAFLQTILTVAGYRTGGFFSPYVVDYRERIQLDCEMIPEQKLADLTEQLLPVAASLDETEFGGVTKFEFEAGLGFQFWKEERCDWVALEVGLGGRLDATNVVTPTCSVIVSIGLDHVAVLGDTHAKIAAEKAGIIKPGVPVVIGGMVPEALEVIEDRAKELGSPTWRFGKEIVLEGDTVQTPAGCLDGLHTRLLGHKPRHNMALAVAALQAAGVKLASEQIREGVAKTTLPGRFQIVSLDGKQWVLDGAHNLDAAEELEQTWAGVFPGQKMTLVTNMVAGHAPEPFYKALNRHGLVSRVVLTPIGFDRAYSVQEMRARLATMFDNVQAADNLEEALAIATEGNETVLVAGSNYLVGELLRLIDSRSLRSRW